MTWEKNRRRRLKTRRRRRSRRRRSWDKKDEKEVMGWKKNTKDETRLRTRKSRSISLCLLHCVPLHLYAERKSMTEKFYNILHIFRCFEVVRQHCWMGTLSIRNMFCFALFICTIHPGWRPCNVTEAFQKTCVFTLNWDFYVSLNPQLALLCLSKTSHLTSLCPEGARNPPEAVWNLSNLTY